MMKLLFIYLVIVNALAFLLMLADKHKAKTKGRRIRERTLLGVCAIGGSVGSLLGMYLLRHKTKHKQFKYGVPFILIIELVVWFYFS